MKKFLRVALIVIGAIVILACAAGFYVKKALPDVGPPPDIRVQITPSRLARGQYLCTNVAGCLVCHSTRDTGVFGAPVEPGTLGRGGELFGPADGLPGNIYAANLTPYHLGNWTDGELFRAITSGVSKDGHALFPLMNYPAFGHMDQEDIYSIIAYLRTLPAIENEVPPTQLDFPVSLIVNTMPAKATLEPTPDTSNAQAYGKYLVRMASCVDCHSPVNKGQVIAGMEFAGGRDFGIVDGHHLYSPNITPDKATGIGNWSQELFLRKFKQYTDSTYTPRHIGAHDKHTPMPWQAFAGMHEKDLVAIYTYLQSVKPISHKIQQ